MKIKKRIFTGLLMGIMLLSNLAIAGAETVEVQDQNKQVIKSIVFAIGKDTYYVNGQTPGVKMDAAPFIENGRTFVPVRFLGNALGVTDDKIGWDQAAQKVTMTSGSVTASMVIGSKDIYSNGIKTVMDVSPQIKPPGRTFLPARYVAEALGYEVDWQNGKYVVVWPKGEVKPDVEAVKNYIEQLVNPPVGTKTQNGYTVPVNTQLRVDFVSGIDVGMMLGLQYPLEQQYTDLTTILASKFGQNLANEIIVYIKTKTERNQGLDDKTWQAAGKTIRVGSPRGYMEITIVVQ